MAFIDAEDAQLLLGCGQQRLRIPLRVFGDLKLRLGDRALVVETLVALERNAREMLVVDSLDVVAEGGGDIRALHVHDGLTLADGVAQAHAQIDDAAVGQRKHGKLARNIRVHAARGVQGAVDWWGTPPRTGPVCPAATTAGGAGGASCASRLLSSCLWQPARPASKRQPQAAA